MWTTKSDHEIVEGCKRNDRRSQELLYRKFFATMMRMVMRYAKDEQIAMEILNNGFLRVFKKMDKYSGTGSLEGWIRRLVFHAISDYYRNKQNPIHFLEIEDWNSVQKAKALEGLYYDDLLDMIKLLPNATQRVFYLYAIEGYTHREIAQEVQISEGTSKWHLSEARKRLQMLIRKQHKTQKHAG